MPGIMGTPEEVDAALEEIRRTDQVPDEVRYGVAGGRPDWRKIAAMMATNKAATIRDPQNTTAGEFGPPMPAPGKRLGLMEDLRQAPLANPAQPVVYNGDQRWTQDLENRQQAMEDLKRYAYEMAPHEAVDQYADTDPYQKARLARNAQAAQLRAGFMQQGLQGLSYHDTQKQTQEGEDRRLKEKIAAETALEKMKLENAPDLMFRKGIAEGNIKPADAQAIRTLLKSPQDAASLQDAKTFGYLAGANITDKSTPEAILALLRGGGVTAKDIASKIHTTPGLAPLAGSLSTALNRRMGVADLKRYGPFTTNYDTSAGWPFGGIPGATLSELPFVGSARPAWTEHGRQQAMPDVRDYAAILEAYENLKRTAR